MPATNKIKWEEEKAREIVDNFLEILGEWFHPNNDWERIEKTADEFLFEDIVFALKRCIPKSEAAKNQILATKKSFQKPV